MPLNPMIVIGCGGSGGKVILSLRRRLGEELQRRGWDRAIPDSFQMKWVDVPTPQESHPEFGEALPEEDYTGLALSDTYEHIDGLVLKSAGERVERLIGWRPSPYIQLPVLQGAGQMRGIGRSVALSNAPNVSRLIERAVRSSQSSRPELESLGECLDVENVSNEPFVFVISSLAGGTGAGIFLDVCDLVRSYDPDLSQRIISILLTAEIFPHVAGVGIPPNSLAASSELMNAMFEVQRHLETLYGRGSAMNALQGAGPSAAYLVGLRTLDESRSLRSPGDAYRVVTESLVALMLDEHLQQEIINYDLTNRTEQQAQRSSRFEMLLEPPHANLPPKCGFVSSFGSAKVSVGSSRFGVWARDRMVRAVLEYLLKGWRDRGLELVDPNRRAVIQDPEIVEHLVNRDREEFFGQCGLWEEDEPDGTRHDQVVDGIMRLDDLKESVRTFHQNLIAEMKSFGQLDEREWVTRIPVVIRNRQTDFRANVVASLAKGSDVFATGVVSRLESAVSKWLAEYGLPVAAGLVKELSQQCRSAAEQLRRESRDYDSASQRNPSRAISASFQSLGGGKVDASSSFVEEAVRKGIGPNRYWAQSERCEKAASLLSDAIDKVLSPLTSELEVCGRELDAFADSRAMHDWPAGSGVSTLYAPAPSEFCLVAASEWSSVYKKLLKESAGSVESARDRICAGGFEYGETAARLKAPTALRLDGGEGWAGRDGRPVTVDVALSPEELKDRAGRFLFDPSHSMGRFMAAGLEEYLAPTDRGVPVADHGERLRRFRESLTSAMQMASPLFRIDQAMMSRLHTKTDLDTRMTIQELPFDAGDPAYEVAKAILTTGGDVSSEAFKSRTKKGVESVLLVRRLATPVHPAVVASLYQPIVRDWDQVVNSVNPTKSIQTFWNNKRARLLQEFIPLPPPAIASIVRGWFVGRLLGLVTDPTSSSAPHIHTRDEFGRERIAAFPWPLLRHGRTSQLADEYHKHEWLPALLEQLPMSMMMLSQDEHALDAYEEIFRLGQRAESEIKQFVTHGTTSSSNNAQVYGDTEEDRKNIFKEAIHHIKQGYLELDEATPEQLAGDYLAFNAVPFGRELFPTIREELDIIHNMIDSMRGGTQFG